MFIRVAPLLLAAVLGAVPAAPAAADDEPLFESHGRFIFEAQREDNLDLEPRDDAKSVNGLEPLLRIGTNVRPGRRLWGYVEAELLHNIERETGEPTERETRLRLNHAFVAYDGLLPDTRLRAGRWLYRDEREWLFDENIDGLHAEFEGDDWQFDAFAGRVNRWQRDLLDSRSRGEPVNTYALLVRREVADDSTVGAYAVLRDDISGKAGRQLFTGLRAHGEPHERLRYWAELGHVRGSDGARRTSGHALDVGATWTFTRAPLQPRLTLGHARGSRHYRQTGLHSNEANFGGLAKFKIYGEAADPDLSNLRITTAGLGLDVGERASLDLVYHRYRQSRVAELGEAAIEPDNDRQGGSGVGHELDLVLGLRSDDDIEMEFVLGRFVPSARFDTDDREPADAAWFGRVRFELNF